VKVVRLMLLTALAVSALAAQGSAGLMAGTVRYAHVDGPDTSVASGPLGGVKLGLEVGQIQFHAEYAEGAIGGDRHVATGALSGLVTMHPILAVGLALSGFAHIDADATVHRWWGVELQARAQYQPPEVPIMGFVTVMMTPLGGVTDTRGFGSLVGLESGVQMEVPRAPVVLELFYRVRRGAAEMLRNGMEVVGVSAVVTF
jgi:hypothetical protein